MIRTLFAAAVLTLALSGCASSGSALLADRAEFASLSTVSMTSTDTMQKRWPGSQSCPQPVGDTSANAARCDREKLRRYIAPRI
jgi:hypothetical protein